MKLTEEFQNLLEKYRVSIEDVSIYVDELSIHKSAGELRGEIYAEIDDITYSGWFILNLISDKLFIEDTFLEDLQTETYDVIPRSVFLEFFQDNMVIEEF